MEAARHSLDLVENVVELAGQNVNVRSIDRSDEARVEVLDDLMRDQIALVLDLLELLRTFLPRP
jgi:hypothetical protein